MLGERDVKKMIDKMLLDVNTGIKQNIDKDNYDRIHAVESSRCTRLAYYERKDPLPADTTRTISILIKQSIRRSFSNLYAEFKVDALALGASADLIVDNEFIVVFEVVTRLPEIPHPRDLLYLNACLFAFNKNDGILVYATIEGETVEFSLTKNNKMFEEVIRRARILSTLLKESKVPIVEPCDLCMVCKYYQRCFARERKTSSGFSLETILGTGKKQN